MFKLKGQLTRFGLLVAGLVMLTLFTALGGLWHYQGELVDQLSQAQSVPENVKQTTQNPAARSGTGGLSQGLIGSNQSARAGTQQNPAAAGQTASKSLKQTTKTSTTTQTTVTPQPTSVSLSLSINGQSRGFVQLPAASNQCNLLSQALTDGIISSLDMRYSSQYGTQAVYVIDGIGDPASVWWTYTVNGHAPPYGCAYVTAHNGDSVNWQYVKD